MIQNELDAILPLTRTRSKESEDFERAKLLIRSLNRFIAVNHAINLFIAVDRDERGAAQRMFLPLTTQAVRISVVHSANIVPDLDRYATHGYHKQQVIKLGFPRLVGREHYLCLDADIVCVQPLYVDRLLADKKSTMGMMSRVPDNIRAWLNASSEVSGLPYDPECRSMTYTPVLLSRDIVRALWQALESKYGLPWYAALLSQAHRNWSEYALYYLMACHSGLLETHHRVVEAGDPKGLVNFGHSFFTAEQAARWNPAAAFTPGAGEQFIICNSGAGMPAIFVENGVDRHLTERPA